MPAHEARKGPLARSGIGPSVLVVAAAAGLTLWSLAALDIRFSNIARGYHSLGWFLDASLPPDLSVLDVAWEGLVETLQIAYLGTLIGLGLSLPVALFASRNLFPWYLSAPARWALAGARVLPSLLWAILFVILVGLGPFAGVLAITFYTVGFLGKLQYEAIEGLPADAIDAVGVLGASKLQVMRFVVVPEAANALVSQALFMFEYNVRHSSIIGVVGAGGIGTYLMGYMRFFQYDKVVALLLLIFALVLLIDQASRLLRERYLETKRPAR